MGVTQSPDEISLTASSMLSGGQVDAALKTSLEMSPPGSDGAAPGVNPSQVSEQHQPEPGVSMPDRDDRWLMSESGAKEPQAMQDSPYPPRDRATGRFTVAKDDGGVWRLTPSSR